MIEEEPIPTILLRNDCSEVDIPLDFPHRDEVAAGFLQMGMKVRLRGQIVTCPICARRLLGFQEALI